MDFPSVVIQGTGKGMIPLSAGLRPSKATLLRPEGQGMGGVYFTEVLAECGR